MLAGKDTGSSVDHDVLLCFSGPELALGATKPQGVNLERSFGASAKWGVWDLGIRGVPQVLFLDHEATTLMTLTSSGKAPGPGSHKAGAGRLRAWSRLKTFGF